MATKPALASNRSPQWAFMERFEVPDYDRPESSYLTRWRIVQTPWFGVYLHRFDGPDPRPTLHDHPWPFASLVLRGGYDERRTYRIDSGATTSVRWLNIKKATDLHWISRLHRTPTWTLMLVGRRRRVWGYLDPDHTWTQFDEHFHNDEFLRAMAARKTQS
jgi:hypothetical protein